MSESSTSFSDVEERRRLDRLKAMKALETNPLCQAPRRAWSEWKRASMARVGIPVVPMRLLKEQARNPRTGLTRRRGELRLVPLQALKAKNRGATAIAFPTARARGAGRPRAQASRSSARSGDSGDDHPHQPVVYVFAKTATGYAKPRDGARGAWRAVADTFVGAA